MAGEVSIRSAQNQRVCTLVHAHLQRVGSSGGTGEPLPNEEQTGGKGMGKESRRGGAGSEGGEEKRVHYLGRRFRAAWQCHHVIVMGTQSPADSFGLIGSCQGNDKINAVFDRDIERWVR